MESTTILIRRITQMRKGTWSGVNLRKPIRQVLSFIKSVETSFCSKSTSIPTENLRKEYKMILHLFILTLLIFLSFEDRIKKIKLF